MIPKLTEAQFQRQVIEAAKLLGWLVFHPRKSKTLRADGSVRHATALQGDCGFPDLVLTRRGVTLIVELKADAGRLGVSQIRWLNALAGLEAIGLNWVSTSVIPAYAQTLGSDSSSIVVVAYPRHLRWLIEVLQNGRVP